MQGAIDAGGLARWRHSPWRKRPESRVKTNMSHVEIKTGGQDRSRLETRRNREIRSGR